MPIRVFGLTGGIASGKSTVAKRLRARRLPVVDADELARQVVAPPSPALDEIRTAFGDSVFDGDELDRSALAGRVFSDPPALEALNRIVHPRVRQLARARVAALGAEGHPLACYEVPLLFEAGLDREYRPVVVVTAPETLCIERARRRSSLTEKEVRSRMNAQWPLAEKAALADYVIANDGTLDRTRRDADATLDAIATAFGVDLARYPRPAT
jgi:dephospho-CoA kinase